MGLLSPASLNFYLGTRILKIARLFCVLGGALVSKTLLAAPVSITSSYKDEVIYITVEPKRFAGAISSVKFRDVEYVDTSDHGREIQSAAQFDGLGECLNPTEAGSKADGRLKISSSLLLELSVKDREMTTLTRPAFWLSPGEIYKAPDPTFKGFCSGKDLGPVNGFRNAQNRTIVSDYYIRKNIRFNSEIPFLIQASTTWYTPRDHKSAVIEALTGYLPYSFGLLFSYDPVADELKLAEFNPKSELSSPVTNAVILSMLDGKHALGAISPTITRNPHLGFMSLSNFPTADAPTTKWSCVYYVENLRANHEYNFDCQFAIGNIDDIMMALKKVLGVQNNNTISIYRFFDGSTHRFAATYERGASSTFRFEKTAFHIYRSYELGRKMVYGCSFSSGATVVVEDSALCPVENRFFEGFVYDEWRDGTSPIYEFTHGANNLYTVDVQEGINNGYILKRVVGYVKI